MRTIKSICKRFKTGMKPMKASRLIIMYKSLMYTFSGERSASSPYNRVDIPIMNGYEDADPFRALSLMKVARVRALNNPSLLLTGGEILSSSFEILKDSPNIYMSVDSPFPETLLRGERSINKWAGWRPEVLEKEQLPAHLRKYALPPVSVKSKIAAKRFMKRVVLKYVCAENKASYILMLNAFRDAMHGDLNSSNNFALLLTGDTGIGKTFWLEEVLVNMQNFGRADTYKYNAETQSVLDPIGSEKYMSRWIIACDEPNAFTLRDINRVKNMVTGGAIECRNLYERSRTIQTSSILAISSNDINPLKFESNDRRWITVQGAESVHSREKLIIRREIARITEEGKDGRRHLKPEVRKALFQLIYNRQKAEWSVWSKGNATLSIAASYDKGIRGYIRNIIDSGGKFITGNIERDLSLFKCGDLYNSYMQAVNEGRFPKGAPCQSCRAMQEEMKRMNIGFRRAGGTDKRPLFTVSMKQEDKK